MVYVVTLTHPTGEKMGEVLFSDLTPAQAFFDRIVQQGDYQRVLILLMEKPSQWEEKILNVEYLEGFTLHAPVTAAPNDLSANKPALSQKY